MDNKLATEITSLLVEAKELHHLAVQLGTEIDENWPVFYGRYVASKLQGTYMVKPWPVTVTVDGAALPPFYTRQTQVEIGSEIASKFHVGE